MKMVDINKMFSDKVAEYLNNGYILCPQSMSGHQGEIGKVDFIKGNELIRVWLNSESSYRWSDDTAWQGNIVVLRVSRWNRPVERILMDMTVWASDLEHIEEYNFYQVSNWGEGWYVDSLEEALRIQNLRHDRWHNKYRSTETAKTILTDDRARTIAANYMRRKRGYKRVYWDRISIHSHRAGDGHTVYYVYYNDKGYKLIGDDSRE